MPCSHEYIGFPRMLICQSEKISVDTDCESPSFLWSPGGYTTQEVDLQAETVHSVTVSCDGCGEDQTEDYCIPIIISACSDPNPPYTYFNFVFTCDNGLSQTITQEAFIQEYTCPGDSSTWSGAQFDLTHLPTGITVDFPGGSNEFEVTVDYAFVLPGNYYIPTRVLSSSGVYSNWALITILVEPGNCCN